MYEHIHGRGSVTTATHRCRALFSPSRYQANTLVSFIRPGGVRAATAPFSLVFCATLPAGVIDNRRPEPYPWVYPSAESFHFPSPISSPCKCIHGAIDSAALLSVPSIRYMSLLPRLALFERPFLQIARSSSEPRIV